MDKPLSLVIEEFKSDVEHAITKSRLTPVILEMIFKDFYKNIAELSAQYTKQEYDNYQNAIQHENEPQRLNPEMVEEIKEQE